MEKEKSLQHYQMPNSMAEKGITPKDALIYLAIKAFNGRDGCFPSLQKIAEKSGASINTIRSSINRLQEAEYIKVNKKGRCNYYEFNDYNKFEPFSPEFLDNKDITFTTKSYLVASQQYMYKDVEGFGKMSYSNRELGKKINMSEFAIRKCDIELKRKEYLKILDNEDRDFETGCKNKTKLFYLDKLGQSIIWLLKDHEQRIQQNTNDIEKLKNELIACKTLLKKICENSNVDSKTYTL